ncbi:hypothetical protein [Paenibacillus sp. MMS18-CY102]|uniref:hypothetical protein n=1 Tax=Paenibacillus sp. MMS18-CY102 TaxID=2682849 RepID=UPI001F1580B0|nr:hypothetical protein [Paenibacillus sp. MMS18-CY102]
MVRRNKDAAWGIVVAALIVLGLVQMISQIMRTGQWSAVLIPVIVLGAVFVLYKYPPGGRARAYRASNGRKQAGRPSRNAAKPRSRSSKTVPFKVIEGGKDDDHFPRYH